MISFEPTYSWKIIPIENYENNKESEEFDVLKWAKRCEATEKKLEDLFFIKSKESEMWNTVNKADFVVRKISKIRESCGFYTNINTLPDDKSIRKWSRLIRRGRINGLTEGWQPSKKPNISGIDDGVWNNLGWFVILPSVDTIQWLNKVSNWVSE